MQGIAAANIIVSSTGTDNTITQPTTDTDVNGQTTATISSTTVETKVISVVINGTTINDTASVDFTAVILPTVGFSSGSSSGSELISQASLNVTLSKEFYKAVIVNYSVTDGTAIGEGKDYELLGNGVLTFVPDDTSEQIDITVINDSRYEGNETIIVTLSNPSNATLGTNTTHTYTIVDNDDEPSVEFSSAGSEGQESASPVTMVVNLSTASGKTVTVDYSTSGDAAEGVDYNITAGPLTFFPGETTKNIPITILDDSSGEADETIIVTLSDATNAIIGAVSSYTYTIIKDDASSIEFTTATSSGPEADSPVLLSVSFLPAMNKEVTVDYSITGGTAIGDGEDYTLDAGTLIFERNETDKTITLTIKDDDVVEPDETIEITLTNPSADATIGTNASHTYTIINDDDETGPEISGYIPEPDSIQVARDTIIQLRITDEMIGSTSAVSS
jgi:hypothetical protein